MPDLTGHSIGRYQIIERLGEGGMAVVYRAHDPQLDRDVAIKVVRSDYFGVALLERILKRFTREARALARLSHPNIVKVLDFGDYEGAPYLVLEYVPGGTLRDRLGTRVPWREVVYLLLPVARALQYAHNLGIVHRDVKPSNVLITESGDPLLSDFGIARLLDGEQTTALTTTGVGIGTPEYMAPEQWVGEAGPSVDIYALGVVFFELIAGRRPYTADTPGALHLKQATEPLPSPRKFVPDLPDAVERTLVKSLARDPADRYPDMSAFIAALEKLSSDKVAPARKRPAVAPAEERGERAAAPKTPRTPPAEGERSRKGRGEEKLPLSQVSTRKMTDLVEPTPVPTIPAGRKRSAEPPPERKRRAPWAWVVVGLAGTVSLYLLIAWLMHLFPFTPGAQPAPEPTRMAVPTEPTPWGYTILPVEPQTFENTLRTNMGPSDIPSLDPAVAEFSSSVTVANSMFIGLTHLNEETNLIEPGMALNWESQVNPDGTQTIVFHMRNDVPWVRWNGNGVETVLDCDGNVRLVTAYDFAYGIRRNLDPVNASPYSYLLGFVLQGAADFTNGVTSDFDTVGVDVIDDTHIMLTFLEPTAYNAQIAGLWVARPQPQWVIEGDACNQAVRDTWTEPGVIQTFGPYTLLEWTHDSSLTMVKNPFWPDTANIPAPRIPYVSFSMLDETAAFAEYEAGNLDTVSVPSGDLDRVKADPVLSRQLVAAPSFCTYYYGFNTQASVVNDARVRRALSLAVDRQGLIDNVLKGGQEPAQWFARPGLAGAPTMEDHPDLGVRFDPAEAQALLNEYLTETGQRANRLELTLMFNTSSNHQRIAEAIQQMWADVLGVNVNLINQEWGVYQNTIKEPDAPQIWRMSWCMDYPDANNFTHEAFALGGNENPETDGAPSGGVRWYNQEFEDVVSQAAVESDPDRRVELYARAEQILVYEDAAIIPIFWYTRSIVTRPNIVRTYSSAGHEFFAKWVKYP